MSKKYQPERTDLLINTDWGTPRDGLSKEEAKDRKMLLFQGRWVSREEKRQLQDERNAYASIRVIGYLFIFISVLVFINIRFIVEGGIIPVAFAVMYALITAVTGAGLIRYTRFARYLAILIFLSFFILPFTVLFENEKGAPLLFITGIAGLYYLLRNTARKILWPSVSTSPVQRKFSSAFRKIIYGIVLLTGLLAGYFIYDVAQARRMTADACGHAVVGLPVEKYLSKFSKEDYKIIWMSESILIVPKRGMGRNHCKVSHDGRIITGAKHGFID